MDEIGREACCPPHRRQMLSARALLRNGRYKYSSECSSCGGLPAHRSARWLAEVVTFFRGRDEPVPHRLFPRKLAPAADRLALLTCGALGRLLEITPLLHFPENAFTLHFLLQHTQRLIDIVVAHQYLHLFLTPCFGILRLAAPMFLDRRWRNDRREARQGQSNWAFQGGQSGHLRQALPGPWREVPAEDRRATLRSRRAPASCRAFVATARDHRSTARNPRRSRTSPLCDDTPLLSMSV